MAVADRDKTEGTTQQAGITWLTLSQARAELAAAIDAFLRAVIADPKGEHDALVARVSAGVGKTEALLSALARLGPELLTHGHVLIYMPTHRLAEEAQRAFAERAPHLPSMVLRGRSALNPDAVRKGPDSDDDDGRMCARWRLAEALRGLVPSITRALCEDGTGSDGMETAPCRSGCPYFAQLPNGNAVVFLAHAYLSTGSPVGGQAVLRVIDEKCWSQFVRIRHLEVEAWLKGAAPKGMSVDRAREAHACVLAALTNGVSPIKALQQLPMTLSGVRRLAHAQTANLAKPACSPSMTDEMISFKVANVSHRAIEDGRKRRAIWRLIAERWDGGATERLTFGPGPDDRKTVGLTLHGRELLQDGVASVFLDADADPIIMDVVAPGHRMIDLAVRPNATVIQVSDRTLSTSALTSGPDAETMRRDVADVIRREVDRTDGSVLVVATKKVLEALQADSRSVAHSAPDTMLIEPLHGAAARWLGPAMQGVNMFKEFSTVVIVGRLEPSAAVVEAQMRALFGDAETSLQFLPSGQGRFQRQKDAWLMSDGSLRSARIQTHPDPRGAALLRQAREAASLQAIARIRAVSAKTPKRIVLLCSLPLPGLPVDGLAPWRAVVEDADPVTLTAPYRKMSAMLRYPNDGRIVDGLRLSPAGMWADAPWAFTSKKAAEKWAEEQTAVGVRKLAEQVLRHAGHSPHFIALRRPGGGRATPAVVVKAEPDLITAAERTWRDLRPDL